MIRMRQIRAFLAIAQHGSIRAAARAIQVSQPALSKTLRDFETALSVPLITRSARGVNLTEYGQALRPRCVMVVAEIARAEDELRQLVDLRGGNVVIGLSPLAALLMGVESLTRLWTVRPEGHVRVVEGMFEFMLAAVEQGRLDFSVGPLPPFELPGSIVAEPLFKTLQYPMVRTGHPLAGAKSLAALQGADWIYPNSDPSFRELIADCFRKVRLDPPRIVLVAESFTIMLEILRNTDLIGFTPASLLRHDLLSKILTVIKVKEALPFTTTALVRRADVPLTPLAEALAKEFRRASRRVAKLEANLLLEN